MSLSTAPQAAPVTPGQFTLFRVVFGLYLALHLAHLAPYAGELFGPEGMLPDPSALPTRLFPNLLAWLPSAALPAVLWALAGLALLFAAGVHRRWVAVLLWYGWACLLARNPFISNPGLPFVGWLLLATALIPEGEPLSLRPHRPAIRWALSPVLFWGAWLLMGVGYTASGLHKLGAPSWPRGEALALVLDLPLARDTALRAWTLSWPAWTHAGLTWGVLALEVVALPLCLWRRSRPYVWAALVAMHLGILSFIAFADLTVGVLMVHLFTFDRRWLRPRPEGTPPVLFFDGVCGLCNHSVDLILGEDRDARLRFAPLQGETSAARLDPALYQDAETGDLGSLVLVDAAGTHLRSEAVLRVMSHLGGLWRALAFLARGVPRGLRDGSYRWMARRRYRFFGEKESCRLPTPAERAVFLD